MADDIATADQQQTDGTDYSAAYSDYSLGRKNPVDYQTRDENTGELQPGYKHVDQDGLFDQVMHGGFAEQQLKQLSQGQDLNADDPHAAQIHKLAMLGMAHQGREAEEHLLKMDEFGDLDPQHSWKVDLIKQRRQEEADQQVVADMQAGKRIIASPEDVQQLQSNANARAKYRSSQFLDDDQRKQLIEDTFKQDAEIRRASTPVPPEVVGASPQTKQVQLYGQFPKSTQAKFADMGVHIDPKTGTLAGIRNFKPPEPSENQSQPGTLGVPGQQPQQGGPAIVKSHADWQKLLPGTPYVTADGQRGTKVVTPRDRMLLSQYGPEMYQQMKDVPHAWDRKTGRYEVDEKAWNAIQDQKMNEHKIAVEKRQEAADKVKAERDYSMEQHRLANEEEASRYHQESEGLKTQTLEETKRNREAQEQDHMDQFEERTRDFWRREYEKNPPAVKDSVERSHFNPARWFGNTNRPPVEGETPDAARPATPEEIDKDIEDRVQNAVKGYKERHGRAETSSSPEGQSAFPGLEKTVAAARSGNQEAQNELKRRGIPWQ